MKIKSYILQRDSLKQGWFICEPKRGMSLLYIIDNAKRMVNGALTTNKKVQNKGMLRISLKPFDGAQVLKSIDRDGLTYYTLEGANWKRPMYMCSGGLMREFGCIPDKVYFEISK